MQDAETSNSLNDAVRMATTASELREQAIRFAHAHDFGLVNLMTVFDHSNGPSDFFAVDNTPKAYKAAYDDPSLGQADPVMQHCKHSSLPIVWNQNTYVSRGRGSLWEYQAQFGYKSGIAIAIHSIGGRHIFLGIDRDGPIDEDSDKIENTIRALKSFAMSAHESAFDIFDPSKLNGLSSKPILSYFEIDLLRWSMDGVSPEEISKITKIDLSIIIINISATIRKMGCSTKYHAVIKALRLGILK